MSRVEFEKAMRLLCLDAPSSTIDALFDVIDQDKSGYLEYRELYKGA